MVRVSETITTTGSIELEEGDFSAKFHTKDGEASGINLYFNSGIDEQSCCLYPILPSQVEDLFNLVMQLRIELKNRHTTPQPLREE